MTRWAKITATVCVNNGIPVYLFSRMCPTPYVVRTTVTLNVRLSVCVSLSLSHSVCLPAYLSCLFSFCQPDFLPSCLFVSEWLNEEAIRQTIKEMNEWTNEKWMSKPWSFTSTATSYGWLGGYGYLCPANHRARVTTKTTKYQDGHDALSFNVEKGTSKQTNVLRMNQEWIHEQTNEQINKQTKMNLMTGFTVMNE